MALLLRCSLSLVLTLAAVASDLNAQLNNVEVDRCTAILVSPEAGTQGAMVTHTADCSDCDFRINKVPAMDHPAGSKRKLHLYKGNYPALITTTRGKTWHPDNLAGTDEQLAAWGKESVITGEIPQIEHTFALIEGGYGVMNEHQVAIGESTCAAKLWTSPTTAGGSARIEARELSQIALERCATAQCAVKLMGELAETYGFYAADWSGGDASKGEGGEALPVIDKTEAWMFHVLGDDSGTSAVWVAQRLEPGHITAVANSFVIQEVDPKSDNFLYSSNLWEVAERNGLWSKKDGLLNFARTYGPERAHSIYSTRRVWRVLSLAAPSLNLPGQTDSRASDYPFSVQVERLLTPQDLVAFQRDHYEGTAYDLTKGTQAGPFGDPHRFDVAPTDGQTQTEVMQGSFERAISMFRTSYSFVAVSRLNVPDIFSLVWMSQYEPAATSYTPMYIAAEVPEAYTKGSLFRYDPDVSFWNFCAAGNYASRFYRYAMNDVKALQDSLTQQAIAACTAVESSASAVGISPSETVTMLSAVVDAQAEAVVSGWRSLLPQLITTYHDGYIARALDGKDINMQKLFYPKWWLDTVGYFDSKPNTGPGVIMFAPSPVIATVTDSTATIASETGGIGLGSLVLTALVSSMLTCVVGMYYIRSRKVLERFNYMSIEV